MRMSELLNEVRRFELDEGFSPREIKMAIGIASDPRYAKGNMTGAVNAIEKMKRGLSKHPQVMAVLKRQNEDLDEAMKGFKVEFGKGNDAGMAVYKDKKDAEAFAKRQPKPIKITQIDVKNANMFDDPNPTRKEAVSPAQQAAIAISKKEKGEKPKEEGNTFGKELKAARDKGEKTFVVSGKKYNVEDYDIDEASKEGTIKIIKTKDGKFQIQKMTKGKFVDIGKPHNSAKEAEKFRSGQPDLFGEEVELGEKYDLYHKDFSSAMQHAYDYAKSKMGITVDPKEIDSKVATGPKKPTEGKTNKYMLKGKGGNLQIQVYNKGGSKPFELNMYKEENNLISAAVGHLSND